MGLVFKACDGPKDLSQMWECLSSKHGALGVNLRLAKEPGGRAKIRGRESAVQSKVTMGYAANMKPVWAIKTLL